MSSRQDGPNPPSIHVSLVFHGQRGNTVRMHIKATQFIFGMCRALTDRFSEDIDCCNTTGFFSCWHKYSEFPKIPQSNAEMHNRNQVGQWNVAEVMCTTSRPDPSWIGMQSYKREGICVREGQPRQELLTLHELKANCCLMLNQWDLRTS